MSISYTELNPNSKIFPNQVMVGADRNDYPKTPVTNLTSAGWKTREQLEADIEFITLMAAEEAEPISGEKVALFAQYYQMGMLSDERLAALVTKGIVSEDQQKIINGEVRPEIKYPIPGVAESGQHVDTTVAETNPGVTTTARSMF